MASNARVIPLPAHPAAAAIVLLRHSLRPAVVAAAVGAVAVAPFAWWFDRPVAGLLLGMQWVVAFAVSMVCHELGHVVAARTRTPEAWRLDVRWTGLVVIGPEEAVGVRSALAGPLCGAAVVLLGAAAGLSAWVAVPLVVLHLVNLTPICPDGRVLAELA